MDIYQTPIDGTTQSAYTSTVNEPWEELNPTSRVLRISGKRERSISGLSSASDFSNVTYMLIDAPTVKGLQRLRTFKSYKDNWDAEGARAPDPETIDSASQVFSLLAMYDAPNVALTPSGHPMFVFSGPNRGEVVVSSPGHIDFYFDEDDAPFGESVAFVGDRLPAEIIEHLQRAR